MKQQKINISSGRTTAVDKPGKGEERERNFSRSERGWSKTTKKKKEKGAHYLIKKKKKGGERKAKR